jgi:hypothetical protein
MKNYKILGLLLLWGLTLSVKAQLRSDSLYKEYYRPQFHFSPEKGWIETLRVLYIIRVNIICFGGVRWNLKILCIINK